MSLATADEVLGAYERTPRALTPQARSKIRWNDVSRYELPPNLISVIVYMRDVERLTELYMAELMRTPSGRDKHIRRFMERWGAEELDHGHLLQRFLAEAGVPVDSRYFERLIANIPLSYKAKIAARTGVSNILGTQFLPIHMAWAAMHEFLTLAGYRRLEKLAGHPVLTQILRMIIREEAEHALFYRDMAEVKLRDHRGMQKATVRLMERTYQSVGANIKGIEAAD